MGKKFFYLILSVFFLIVLLLVSTWESSYINYESTSDLNFQIHSGYNRQNFNIKSWASANFEVFLVPNATKKALNPYFPQIHIRVDKPHNAWIQVVHTDSKDPRYKVFVDTAEETKLAPFYTLDKDFYDSPLWSYTFFKKPITFWHGHAYAVNVDHEKKTIECLGGIKWGFELKYTKLRPVALLSQSLSQSDWNKDSVVFAKKLPGYKFI